MIRRFMVAGVLCLAVGCGGSESNRLFGSVSEVYNLEFDQVGIMMVTDYLVVEYTKPMSMGTVAKVAKLTVNLAGLAIAPNQDVDLTQMVGSSSRGSLQRVVESTIDLPIMRGTVTVEQVPRAGAEVSGRFRTTLSDPAGRTLNGDFRAVVQQR